MEMNSWYSILNWDQIIYRNNGSGRLVFFRLNDSFAGSRSESPSILENFERQIEIASILEVKSGLFSLHKDDEIQFFLVLPDGTQTIEIYGRIEMISKDNRTFIEDRLLFDTTINDGGSVSLTLLTKSFFLIMNPYNFVNPEEDRIVTLRFVFKGDNNKMVERLSSISFTCSRNNTKFEDESTSEQISKELPNDSSFQHVNDFFEGKLDTEGRGLFLRCCMKGNLKLLKILLENDSDQSVLMKQKDKLGRGCLYYSLMNRKWNQFFFLLREQVRMLESGYQTKLNELHSKIETLEQNQNIENLQKFEEEVLRNAVVDEEEEEDENKNQKIEEPHLEVPETTTTKTRKRKESKHSRKEGKSFGSLVLDLEQELQGDEEKKETATKPEEDDSSSQQQYENKIKNLEDKILKLQKLLNERKIIDHHQPHHHHEKEEQEDLESGLSKLGMYCQSLISGTRKLHQQIEHEINETTSSSTVTSKKDNNNIELEKKKKKMDSMRLKIEKIRSEKEELLKLHEQELKMIQERLTSRMIAETKSLQEQNRKLYSGLESMKSLLMEHKKDPLLQKILEEDTETQQGEEKNNKVEGRIYRPPVKQPVHSRSRSQPTSKITNKIKRTRHLSLVGLKPVQGSKAVDDELRIKIVRKERERLNFEKEINKKLTEENRRLKNELKSSKKRTENMTSKLENNKKMIFQLNRKLDQSSEESERMKKSMEEKLKRALKKNKGVEKMLNEKKMELERVVSKSREKEDESQSLGKKEKKFKKLYEEEKKNVSLLKKKIKRLEKERKKELGKSRIQMIKDLAEMRRKFDPMKDERNRFKKDCDVQRKKIRDLIKKINGLERKTTSLEKDIKKKDEKISLMKKKQKGKGKK